MRKGARWGGCPAIAFLAAMRTSGGRSSDNKVEGSSGEDDNTGVLRAPPESPLRAPLGAQNPTWIPLLPRAEPPHRFWPRVDWSRHLEAHRPRPPQP
jgi:hypothetical protein